MSGRWRSRHWSGGESSSGEWRRGQALPSQLQTQSPTTPHIAVAPPEAWARRDENDTGEGVGTRARTRKRATIPKEEEEGSDSAAIASHVPAMASANSTRRIAWTKETDQSTPTTDAAPNVWAARERSAIAISSAIAVENKRSSTSIKNGISPPSLPPQPSPISSSSSSSILPTSSTWGKGGGSTHRRGADARRNDGKVAGAAREFPPLSSASSTTADRLAPQTTSIATPSSRSWPTAIVTPAKVVENKGGKERGTKTNVVEGGSSSSSSSSKKNKNGKITPATTTSLASYISSPPIPSAGIVGRPSGRGPPSRPPPTRSLLSSSGNGKAGGNTSSAIVVSGVKRRAHAACGDDSRGDGSGMYPAIAAGRKVGRVIVAARGAGRLQRMGVPRKKKLTSLKKKVLRERLRMWKEKNGTADDVGECNDTDDDDDDERGGSDMGAAGDDRDEGRPVAKRLRTDGASQDTALSAGEWTTDTRTTTTTTTRRTTLLVKNFIRPDEDDLLDDEEYEEITSDLFHLAGGVGRVVAVFVPRPSPRDDDDGEVGHDDNVPSSHNRHVGSAIVRFATGNDACAARDILNGIVVGGRRLRTSILDSVELARWDDRGTYLEHEWRVAVLETLDDGRLTSVDDSGEVQTDYPFDAQMDAPSALVTIVFHEILCNDDYEDEEAFRESVEDIRGLAGQFGRVIDARGSTSGSDRGNVYIVYDGQNSAEMALTRLNGLVISGSVVKVSRYDVQSTLRSEPGEVILNNALNDDDIEDEDCLNESLKDIRSLAEQFGIVGSVLVELSGGQRKVLISFPEGQQAARQAAQKLDGIMLGGIALSASIASPMDSKGDNDCIDTPKKPTSPPLPPIYSGDKIIPEQFAACKRVPKIPNAGAPRSYASKIADESGVIMLSEMLGELMRLQERSKDDKNARARRRIVMGLREVARGIRAHKVKMVVMANNLDEYGAIDSKLQEILDLARAEELPVLYELNKRKLGKALGKSIKVSVVGIQNADGAQEQFKKLKKMVGSRGTM